MSRKRFHQGLVVGKFAPLHRGHQLVIDTAREQCAELAVLSYAKPEFRGCDSARRREWLAALYPHVRSLVLDDAALGSLGGPVGLELPDNEAPADVHRLFVARVCHELMGLAIDAVFTSEDYGAPFAAALTAYQRTRVPGAGPVRHVAVDPERARLPISGTLIRSAPYEHRQWLSPLVYASMIARVVLLGAESSGKTLLAHALAHALRTVHVEEYGRELWLKRGGKLDQDDLLRIAREQVRREETALAECREVLICDTSPFTTALYSQLMFGRIPDELEELARRRYALIVCCVPDFPFVQDGTRVDSEFQATQHALTLAELTRRGLPYVEVRGSVERRVQDVMGVLRERRLISSSLAAL